MNNKEEFYLKLIEKIGKEKVLKDEPMAYHTSFEVGGPTDFLVLPETIEDTIDIIKLCKAKGIPFYIVGKGSNLLVSDKGYRGAIIKINGDFSDVSINLYSKEDDTYLVHAQAGISLSDLSKTIAKEGLVGFEFAAGIPGTLGGAVNMNAGAYDGEIKDYILSATVLDKGCNIIKLSKDELELGYRSSIIQKEGYVVLEAEFVFEKGNPDDVFEKIEDLNNRRCSKQPLEYPSAGSAFKRPEGYYAGKLIMDCGLKGCKIGGAQVSEKHCGFIINVGGATASDVRNLLEHVKGVVYDKYKVDMEQEVKMLGEF